MFGGYELLGLTGGGDCLQAAAIAHAESARRGLGLGASPRAELSGRGWERATPNRRWTEQF